jgi:hypothetical protein
MVTLATTDEEDEQGRQFKQKLMGFQEEGRLYRPFVITPLARGGGKRRR